MGGYGSGRSGAPRPTVETSLSLELPRLRREGHVKPGQRTHGRLVWTLRGDEVGRVEFVCRMDPDGPSVLALSFSIDGKSITQRIRLEPMPMRFGGMRWYFICPRTSRRCTTLVLPAYGDGFASVKGWGLAYQSQREDAFGRAKRRLAKAEGRLARLSKYARTPTRDRLWGRIERAEAVFDYGAVALAAALLGKPFISRSEAGRARERDLVEED
jgi:hypothetical protein